MNSSNTLFRRFSIGGALLWLVAFAVIPICMLMIAAVLSRSETGLVEPVFTLMNFTGLLRPELFSMLLRSVWMAAMAMLLCLLAGYPFAYIVARADKGMRGIMLLLVMIPFWTNSLIRTYALVAILKTDGILNKALLFLGFIEEPLKLMYTPTAAFIGLVYTLLPFMILPLYAAITRLDNKLHEAARDLGASRWKTFRTITIPLTMPGILSGCMLVFLPALGMFYVPDVLGGARSMLLGNYIRDQFLVSRDIPMGSAASVALTCIMGCMLAVYYRSVRRSGRRQEL